MHESYDYGLWTMVLINVLIFGGFVFSFLGPKKRVEWRSLGAFAAFHCRPVYGDVRFSIDNLRASFYIWRKVGGNQSI